jgi:hypothetical protein
MLRNEILSFDDIRTILVGLTVVIRPTVNFRNGTWPVPVDML